MDDLFYFEEGMLCRFHFILFVIKKEPFIKKHDNSELFFKLHVIIDCTDEDTGPPQN